MDAKLCQRDSAARSCSASPSAPISSSQRSKSCSISRPASSSSGTKSLAERSALGAQATDRGSVRRQDVRVLGELHRFCEIVADEPFELLDAHRLRLDAEFRQSFLNLRHVQSLLALV